MRYALPILVFPFIVAGSLPEQFSAQEPVSKRIAAGVQLGLQPRQHSLSAEAGEHYMQRAWYEYGTSQSPPPTATQNEFVVIADASRKPKDFVSSAEQWLRQGLAARANPAALYATSPWRELTAQQRQTRLRREQNAYRRQADSLHAVNNQEHTLIWLLNNSAEPVVLGTQDGSVFCVLQALDKNQQWQPVQYWHYSGCGNSYSAHYLRPNETLALLAKIPTTGDFKAKLRYKLAGIKQFYYSNAFAGRISYSEFAEPPGRYGRSATGQRVATFKLDSLPNLFTGRRRAFPFHQGGKWGDLLPY